MACGGKWNGCGGGVCVCVCGCGGGSGWVRRQCSHTKMRTSNGRNALPFQLNFKKTAENLLVLLREI